MYTYRKDAPASIALIAGQRAVSDLANGVQSHGVLLRLRATLTIAVANAAAIVNSGTLAAIFDEIGILENGVVRQIFDGRDLAYVTQVFATQRTSAVRATSLAQAAYALDEVIRIPFTDQFSMVPRETAFREHNVNNKLQVFAKLTSAANPATKLATAGGGGGTVALTNITVDVVHDFDMYQEKKPYFIPTTQQQVHVVAGAAALDPHFLNVDLPLRGLLIATQDAAGNDSGAIINKLALKGTNGDLIGPNQIDWPSLVEQSELEFLGSVLGDKSRLFLKFTKHGQNSNALNPTQFLNLKAVMDVAAAAGAQVRFTLFQLEPDAQLCDPAPYPV